MRTIVLLTIWLGLPTSALAGPLWLPLKDLVAESVAIAEIQLTLGKRPRVKLLRWLRKPSKGVVVPKRLPVCIASKQDMADRRAGLFTANYYQVVSHRKRTYKETLKTWRELPATKHALAVLARARHQGSYRAVLTYIRCLKPGEQPVAAFGTPYCKKGERPILLPRCHFYQGSLMRHWLSHPEHKKWRRRLMKLLGR